MANDLAFKRKLTLEGNLVKDSMKQSASVGLNFSINQNQISLYQGNDTIYLDHSQIKRLIDEYFRFNKMLPTFSGE